MPNVQEKRSSGLLTLGWWGMRQQSKGRGVPPPTALHQGWLYLDYHSLQPYTRDCCILITTAYSPTPGIVVILITTACSPTRGIVVILIATACSQLVVWGSHCRYRNAFHI